MYFLTTVQFDEGRLLLSKFGKNIAILYQTAPDYIDITSKEWYILKMIKTNLMCYALFDFFL